MPKTKAITPLDYGRLVCTAAVDHAMGVDPNFNHWLFSCYKRHMAQDWGDLDAEDKALNDEAFRLRDGSRLFSSYNCPVNFKLRAEKLWIITDGWGNDPKNPDHCHTTILFPEDY